MSATENGWHIKAEGYMTSEPSFQKITPKKACDAIEFRRVLTFMRHENGIVADHRTYVPREFLAEEHAKNNKLRELVRDVWEWELHGCDACNLIETAECDTDIYSEDCLMRVTLSDRMRELGIEV